MKKFRFCFVLIALILLQTAGIEAQPFHRLQARRNHWSVPIFEITPYNNFNNNEWESNLSWTETPCDDSENVCYSDNNVCIHGNVCFQGDLCSPQDVPAQESVPLENAESENNGVCVANPYNDYYGFDESYLVGESYEVGEKVSLFNGVDLTGWTNPQGEKPSDGWQVEDGVIHKAEGSGGDLYTEKKYENFILEFEFKIEKDGNSGVKYKTWIQENGWGTGCEYQIYDDLSGQDNGETHRTGALYDLFAPKTPVDLLKVGEFNQGKIIVMGNYISHWLNGVETFSTVIDSAEWRDRFAKSKFAEDPQFGHLKATPIFLQDHSSPAWFRNISITELKPIDECGIYGGGWNPSPETPFF